jgi:hypothetical protein
MALVGNTVRLIATFKDFDGVATDAANIAITVTDMTGVVEELTMTGDNKQLDGTYTTTYTIPEGVGPLKIEIRGDVEGLPEVNHIKVCRED